MYREMAGQIEARQACTGNLQKGGAKENNLDKRAAFEVKEHFSLSRSNHHVSKSEISLHPR